MLYAGALVLCMCTCSLHVYRLYSSAVQLFVFKRIVSGVSHVTDFRALMTQCVQYVECVAYITFSTSLRILIMVRVFADEKQL